MMLLLDQDVYATTARFLASRGHDVVHAAQIGLSRATDEELLAVAQRQGRVFVTRDRDFGALVFVKGMGAGVLYLRTLPSTLQSVHGELARVLDSYSQEQLHRAFVVIEPDRHRFRGPLDR
jgi:predicted nuclease of predicted toxin-antitoxin system